MTGSATRKPRLVRRDEGRNQNQTTSLPGSTALWARSGTFRRRLPVALSGARRAGLPAGARRDGADLLTRQAAVSGEVKRR